MPRSMDSSDPHDPQDSESASVRKRVGRACDRCRNKKSKCDGHQQCERCKLDLHTCTYTHRDKAQEKTWPKGTVETMQDSMNIMEDSARVMCRILKHLKQWPPQKGLLSASQAGPGDNLSVHDIAAALDCIPPDKLKEKNCCNQHGSVAEGILKARSHQDCQPLSEQQFENKTEIASRANHAWPGYLPQEMADPLLDLNLKQEEPPMQISQSAPSALNRQYPPAHFQARSSQSGRRLRGPNTGAHQRSTFTNPPTPSYSPEATLNQQQPYINFAHHVPNLPCESGPQCFDDCPRSSAVPCTETFDPQYALFPLEQEPLEATYVDPQVFQPEYVDQSNFTQDWYNTMR